MFLNTGPGFVEWVDPAVTLSLSSILRQGL